MDWTKYAKKGETKPPRVTFTMTPQLRKALQIFMDYYPEEKFTVTSALQTMVEAGLRVWHTSVTEVQDEGKENDH